MDGGAPAELIIVLPFVGLMIQSRNLQTAVKEKHMHLAEGLEILVEDWQALHEDGGTKQSVEQVVVKLGIDGGNTIPPGLKPAQVAERIMNELRKIPGARENAEKFMAQFQSAEELLEEIDLDCLVSDLATTEGEEQ
jgi:hypothetical protein